MTQFIKFKSDSYMDTLIFSGVTIDKGVLRKYEANKNKIGLIDDVGTAAIAVFQQIDKAYEDYKISLNSKMTYEKLLTNVEKNISRFKSTERETIDVVANKILELAKKQEEIEGKMNGAELFFHKLGQVLFKFRNFETESEFGKKLATNMKTFPFENFKSELKGLIFHPIGLKVNEVPPKQRIFEMKEAFNKLPQDQFKSLIKDVIFSKKETETFGSKNKLAFFINLTPENKQAFNKELLSRSDWFEQIDDILDSVDVHPTFGNTLLGSETAEKTFEELPYIDQLITDEMISCFQSDPNRFQLIRSHEQKEYCRKGSQQFVDNLLIKTMKNYIENNNLVDLFLLLNNTKGKAAYLNQLTLLGFSNIAL